MTIGGAIRFLTDRITINKTKHITATNIAGPNSGPAIRKIEVNRKKL
jgi:hypothetical protein